jgi:hypothetical protein
MTEAASAVERAASIAPIVFGGSVGVLLHDSHGKPPAITAHAQLTWL